LDAAMQLVAERGIDATSMDAIAAKSGVSKATIYKHWTDKDALLLEMVAVANGLHTRPTFDTGDTRADIQAVLAYRPPEHVEMRERIMPHFAAYAHSNVNFGIAWRNMVTEPPRRELRRLIESGIEKGELTPGLNVDHSLALLLGPLIYWYIFARQKTDDPSSLAACVVDTFWRAYGLKKAKKAR
jgi:AcrR family transcriptional regulator